MDLNGGRRPTPLIETPKRPPWMVIILVIAGLVVIGWALSNMNFRVRELEGPFQPRNGEEDRPIPVAPEGGPPRVIERDVIEPIAPPVAAGVGPTWVEQPIADFPEAGDRAPGGAGRVVLSCVVGANGALEACRVVSETPEGYGFGPSALEGARRARLSPNARPGAKIAFTVRFEPARN